MNTSELCELGLNLRDPWYVSNVAVQKDADQLVLHISIDYRKGTKFAYEDGQYTVYDHQQRTWSHLNFFEHQCYLHAHVPRVKLPDGKVKLVAVPWAASGSGFTLKYEAYLLELLSKGMSASAVGSLLNINSKRVFRALTRYVAHAICTQDIKSVSELAVDETSFKKGHNYFTILSDRKAKKVVGVSIGKDKEAVAHALIDMEIRGGDRQEVRAITMDMSTSYIAAAAEYMEQADIVFDRFHLAKKMNEAVDAIRKSEPKQYSELKSSRYLWL